MVLWFYVQEHPKAQLAVVLVLKLLRRQGNSLFKSHPTDWEKLGIKPATPGLQDIGIRVNLLLNSINILRDKCDASRYIFDSLQSNLF